MTGAWYRVLSYGFGYVAAAIAAAIVLLSARKQTSDARLWRRVRRGLPQAGVLRVMSAKGRKLAAGLDIPVPYEGTLGAAMSCDVRIPARRVHLRSAFFWMEGDALHMVALHRDGFMVDDVPVEPGDEAVLHDGAVLCVGGIRLAWRVSRAAALRGETPEQPYVTRARRSRAQQGAGEGLGAPRKAATRRERRRSAQDEDEARPVYRARAAKPGAKKPAAAKMEKTNKTEKTGRKKQPDKATKPGGEGRAKAETAAASKRSGAAKTSDKRR